MISHQWSSSSRHSEEVLLQLTFALVIVNTHRMFDCQKLILDVLNNQSNNLSYNVPVSQMRTCSRLQCLIKLKRSANAQRNTDIIRQLNLEMAHYLEKDYA